MIFLATLAWALQAPDLLYRVVPHPTGQNGYEEYLRAADVLNDPEAKVLAGWTPGAKPPKQSDILDDGEIREVDPPKAVVDLFARLNAMSPLEVRREELRRFGRALDLVARGNGKAVYDPRPNAGPDALFPEFASFRTVAKFATRAASVYAADGRTDRAVDVLLDQMTCADNFGRGVIIANLVGVAMEAIQMAAVGELLPRLSHADAVRIERYASAFLARPVAVRASVLAEAEFAKASLRQMFALKAATPGIFAADDDEKPDPKSAALAKEFNGLGPAGRQSLLRRIEARLDAQAKAMDRILAEPEGKWHDGFADLEEVAAAPVDLGDAILGTLSPVYTAFVDAAARNRTQVRLLGLHARLIAYLWEYGRYPESLDEPDPLSGERFVYEIRPDGTVRLASKGIPATGEIELKYKRVVKDQEEVKP